MAPYLSIFALVILSLCLLILLILKNPTPTRSKQQLPPSPPKLPFIGNAHQLGPLLHRSLHSLSQRYGPLMLLRLGVVPTLVVSSADAAREVLKTHNNVFSARPPVKAARILFKNGIDIAFANGEHWRQGRKLSLNHLLGPKMVRSFRHIRDEEVDSLLARISADASLGKVTDLSELLMSFTNKVTCSAILGDFTREEMNKMLCDLSREDSRLLQKFYVGDYFPFFGWLDELSGLGSRTRALAKRWDDFLDEVIADHLHSTNSIQLHDDDEEAEGKKSCFLGVLLSLQKDAGSDMNLTTEKIKVLAHVMSLYLELFFNVRANTLCTCKAHHDDKMNISKTLISLV